MRRYLLSGVLLSALAAAGCGSSSDSSSSKPTTSASKSSASSSSRPYSSSKSSSSSASGKATKLAIAADPSGAIKFDKTALAAKAGKVTVTFTNKSQVPHGFAIKGSSSTKIVTGGQSTLTVALKPGKYTFYCPVGDHAQEGMKGTLTVQ